MNSNSNMMSAAKKLVCSWRVLSDTSLFLMTDMACLSGTFVTRFTTLWELMISSYRTLMLLRSLLKSTVFVTWYLVLPMSGLRRSAMTLEVLHAINPV